MPAKRPAKAVKAAVKRQGAKARRAKPGRARAAVFPVKPAGLREITTHQVGVLNEKIRIQVLDDPSHGGANHEYRVHVPALRGDIDLMLPFQKGPVQEAGLNGISIEVLLAVAQDRMEGFESGPFASPLNRTALKGVKTALRALQARTKSRVARGVEGRAVV